MASDRRNGFIVAVLAGALLAGIGGVYGILGSLQSPKEMDQFRGIRWGAPVAEVSGLRPLAEDGELVFYVRDGDKLSIENVEVNQVVYGFYKGRFYNAIVYYRTAGNFSMLKDHLYGQLGNAYHPVYSEKRYFWDGDKVSVLLTFDDASDEGRISFLFKPIAGEVVPKEEQEKKGDGVDDGQ